MHRSPLWPVMAFSSVSLYIKPRERDAHQRGGKATFELFIESVLLRCLGAPVRSNLAAGHRKVSGRREVIDSINANGICM